MILFTMHNCYCFANPGDCSEVSLDDTVSQVIPNVTVNFTSPLLQPVYPGANTVTLHVWTPGFVTLSVSDDTLERVSMWKEPTCREDDPARFQTARIMATSNFTSGGNQFTANVLSIVADRVSWTLLKAVYYSLHDLALVDIIDVHNLSLHSSFQQTQVLFLLMVQEEPFKVSLLDKLKLCYHLDLV